MRFASVLLTALLSLAACDVGSTADDDPDPGADAGFDDLVDGGGGGGGDTDAGGGGGGGGSGGGEPTASDPITTAETGAHATYDVGPGKDYETPDTVPWGSLVAGDVVNIYYRDTPYATKLCLRGQGTAAAPIVVNGVTDASGNRPRFDFDGAQTASGCNPGGGDDIFDTGSQWSLEDYAGIILRPGVGDDYGTKPSHIHIKNLELFGARPGASFVDLGGDTVSYIGSPAAIWIQPSADVLLENNVIYDNGFGVFTMSKDSTMLQACERITLRSNRVWDNGVVDSWFEHNVYMQSTNPLIEGNYFGPTRDGSLGSTYKSRSSGEIFRYNYVEASARAIDWVHAEDQNPGIATQADYGVDYAYGNVIVNDCNLSNCAANPIHYGGDNLGEQEDVSSELMPSQAYRSRLYFYNNTVVHRVDSGDSYRTSVFDLSLRSTTVEAWNNVFALNGSSNFSWVEGAGRVNLRGTNLAFGSVTPANDRALDVNYDVQMLGTIETGDPAFAAADDYRPGAGSPALDAATGLPGGIDPDSSYMHLPVALQPYAQNNGMHERAVNGAALDLGALEGP